MELIEGRNVHFRFHEFTDLICTQTGLALLENYTYPPFVSELQGRQLPERHATGLRAYQSCSLFRGNAF